MSNNLILSEKNMYFLNTTVYFFWDSRSYTHIIYCYFIKYNKTRRIVRLEVK